MDIQEVILKILRDEEASAEYRQLKEWKEETSENLKLYQEINKIVEEGNNLSDYKEFNVESGYARFKKQISKSPYSKVGILVMVLLLLGGALYILSHHSKHDEPQKPQSYIAENIVEEVNLNDGSTITLNEGARLSELSDFSTIRNVSLIGEAFFDIAPDKEKPFRIILNEEIYVEVLGTSFNIINNESNLEVVVESGLVELHFNGRAISLTKGYAAKKEKGSIVKYKKSADNYLSWKTQKLVYKNTPITDVLEDISKHFDIKLNISDAIYKSKCNLSSTFQTHNLDQILNELTKLVSLSFSKQDDGSYAIKDIQCE